MIRVAIVEDHAKARSGLGLLVDGTEGFQLVASCANAAQALRLLPAERPDVVLMDIKLPDLSGVECVRQLKRLLPGTQFLMVTAFADDDLLFESLKAGASGYLLKRTAPARLLEAITEVTQGGSPMTGSLARRLVEFFRGDAARITPLVGLTSREQEILRLLAEGRRYKEIAETLAVSYDTVRAHIRSIYDKLRVHSRAEAVARLR